MELLTVAETAEALKVTTITIRRYIADGRLPAVRVGKGVRVRKEAVDQLLTPIEPKRGGAAKNNATPAGHPLTYEDPLWQLVGSAVDAPPSDASQKYEYLAEGFTHKQS
jgi:excisionase family DNA binding protein